MSDGKSGPAIPDTVTEVQAVFASDAALQAAIGQLEQAGFDRADFSLPVAGQTASGSTPEQGATTPVTQTDVRQARTLGVSLAGSVGALAAAGATIATGGAAGIAIAAAAAAGIGAGAVAGATGNAADSARRDSIESSAAAGTLTLTVRTPTAERRERAKAILDRLGADQVGETVRTSGAVDSTSWTG